MTSTFATQINQIPLSNTATDFVLPSTFGADLNFVSAYFYEDPTLWENPPSCTPISYKVENFINGTAFTTQDHDTYEITGYTFSI